MTFIAAVHVNSPSFGSVYRWKSGCKGLPVSYGGAGRLVSSRMSRAAASDDEGELELAVFRFTLGIPGFDDALIPRVVSVVGLSLLLLNHVLSGEDFGDTRQSVTEFIGIMLAGVGIAAPTLQKRIEESTPGKGRRAAVENLEGSANVFAISEELTEYQKREAAWSSFAIIKNANVCGVYVSIGESSVVCRGALGAGLGTGDECLSSAYKAFARTSINQNSFEYFDSKDKIKSSPLKSCEVVPAGAGSVAVLPIKPLDRGDSLGSMILVCDRERSMSPKELSWCQSVCSKLYFAFKA
jgi:hypothetical protein